MKSSRPQQHLALLPFFAQTIFYSRVKLVRSQKCPALEVFFLHIYDEREMEKYFLRFDLSPEDCCYISFRFTFSQHLRKRPGALQRFRVHVGEVTRNPWNLGLASRAWLWAKHYCMLGTTVTARNSASACTSVMASQARLITWPTSSVSEQPLPILPFEFLAAGVNCLFFCDYVSSNPNLHLSTVQLFTDVNG